MEDDEGSWLLVLWLVFTCSGVLTGAEDEAASCWLWVCSTYSQSTYKLTQQNTAHIYMASRHLPTHALFDLYFAHLTSSLFKPTTTMVAALAEEESFLGGQHRNAVPMPVSCLVNRGCADRLIRNSPWSSTKVPRLQKLTICNLKSAVRPHFNATLYS